VGGERVVEARREPGLTQEALDPDITRPVARRVARAQDLDHRLPAEPALLGAVDHAVTALAQLVTDREVAERAVGQRSVRRAGHDPRRGSCCRIGHRPMLWR
jgi:hypothetical protein